MVGNPSAENLAVAPAVITSSDKAMRAVAQIVWLRLRIVTLLLEVGRRLGKVQSVKLQAVLHLLSSGHPLRPWAWRMVPSAPTPRIVAKLRVAAGHQLESVRSTKLHPFGVPRRLLLREMTIALEAGHLL